ncbi:MAG: glycoside hydrolase family 11 protein, partial [Oscillospiraceae bacterium]|nr:glycoside hydrolase family 11 protein [Oscillospiraceae bacterium]
MRFNKLLSGMLAATMAVVMMPIASASAETYSLPGGGQKSGDLGGGYHYELWIDSTGGNGSMTVNSSGGEFDAVWDCSVPRGNYLARNGKTFDRSKKATEYGNITMDYEASYQQTGSNNGNSRLCVYGWMIEPSSQEVIEYYIIEDWVSWVPSPDGSFAAKTVNIDGGDYDIFWIWHEGPTIKGGSERFKQYFSVRKDKRTSGRITVSDHFAAWEKAGMTCFNLTEVALNAEGYQSSGRANVTKNVITVGGTPEPTDPPTEPPTDGSGYYFYDTFEDGMGNWAERGEDKVAASSAEKYKGSKSAAVTDLSDYWNGIGRSLSPSVFKPGNSYSFSAMAMQNTTSSEHFKLSLEYTNASGEQTWDTIAEADGTKGEWVQLANTSYTIPTGASGMTLYVETDDTTTPFFVDEMVGGVKGATYEGYVTQPTQGKTDPQEPTQPLTEAPGN